MNWKRINIGFGRERVILKKKNKLPKRRVRDNMKLGQQELGVYPLWIGFLLLDRSDSIRSLRTMSINEHTYF